MRVIFSVTTNHSYVKKQTARHFIDEDRARVWGGPVSGPFFESVLIWEYREPRLISLCGHI